MIPITLSDVAGAVGAACSPGQDDRPVRRVVTDSRDAQPGDLFIALRGQQRDGHEFIGQALAKGAVACLCHRDADPALLECHGSSAPPPLLVVADTILALGRLASYYRQRVMPTETVVVAVTGSNGKTTTKCMIDHVLRGSLPGRAAPKSFNNHIGVPLTLLSAGPTDRYLLVELGTNAPGEIASLAAMVRPEVAVITSIGEAHLEGLGDIDRIAAEKASVLDFLRPHGLAVVNIDRSQIRPHLGRCATARLVTIGQEPAARLRVAAMRATTHSTSFLLDDRHSVDLAMPGLHHATNAAAAFAVARWFGLSPDEIVERLRSFTPPAGRASVIELDGLTLVDDTYNGNPASMTAAAVTLSAAVRERRVLVMGDMRELGADTGRYHRQLIQTAAEAGIETVVAVGPDSAQAARELAGKLHGTRLLPCDDLAAAAHCLMATVSAGDTVWFKGSRAMHLDQLVTQLRGYWGERAAVA